MQPPPWQIHSAAAASPSCFAGPHIFPVPGLSPASSMTHAHIQSIALYDWQQQKPRPGHSLARSLWHPLCEAGSCCTLQQHCHRSPESLGQQEALSTGIGQEPDKLRSLDKV